MKLTLLNKNTPVADVEFNTRRGGYISDIIKVINPEYAPIGIVDDNKILNIDDLSDWWEERCIPDSRSNVEQILEYMQCDKQELVIQSLGLSLSDQYWVKPTGSDILWKDVNFFTNSFSENIGDIFFHERRIADRKFLEDSSPDYTLNGYLNKRWIIENNERILIKGGYNPFNQQPYNEVIASNILSKLEHSNFVSYSLQNNKYSACSNFITENTEYVPSSLIRKRLPKEDNESYFKHFMRCCKKLGFAQIMQDNLDYILLFDYLMANTDRNFGNFGVIRNVETLQIISMAPIFDNGNSLWYNSVKINHDVKAYPFEMMQDKQIKLVQNFDKIPIHKLNDIGKICSNTLILNPDCDDVRCDIISEGLERRLKMLNKIIDNKRNENKTFHR